MAGDVGINQLTAQAIACVIRVHHTLGPGFLEKVYRCALMIELRKNKLQTESEKEIVIYYDGCEVGLHRLDIVVESKLIIELKTVETLGKSHYAQIRSYLKASRLDAALLVNFAGARADFRRIDSASPTIPISPSLHGAD